MKVRSTADPAPILGVGVGLALCVVVSATLIPVREGIARATPGLVLVLPVLAAGVLGGRMAALATAVLAAGAFNLAFIRPYWTLKVAVVDDAVALGVFMVVAVAFGTLVAREAHGGAINVRPSPGGGARFAFTIPGAPWMTGAL